MVFGKPNHAAGVGGVTDATAFADDRSKKTPGGGKILAAARFAGKICCENLQKVLK